MVASVLKFETKMDSMTSFDFAAAEKQIIHDPSSRGEIRKKLISLQKRTDYIVSRFIDDHPDYEKHPLKHKFYVGKSETYSKITRLLRIISAYDR